MYTGPALPRSLREDAACLCVARRQAEPESTSGGKRGLIRVALLPLRASRLFSGGGLVCLLGAC